MEIWPSTPNSVHAVVLLQFTGDEGRGSHLTYEFTECIRYNVYVTLCIICTTFTTSDKGQEPSNSGTKECLLYKTYQRNSKMNENTRGTSLKAAQYGSKGLEMRNSGKCTRMSWQRRGKKPQS